MGNMHEFPLHCAAEEGDLDRVRQLIEGGVSMDSRDEWGGRTPLHCAAERGRHEVAELLISNKCDLNPKDNFGLTPVMSAAESYKKDIVHLLLQRGAQVDCADEDRRTLLHCASHKGLTSVVQYILDRGGADINAETCLGNTPLKGAAEKGHADVAALLIRAGADVNRGNEALSTPLHCAAAYGHPQVVQALLEVEGLDLNPQDEDGRTPLHDACKWGCREVIKQLLEAGADTTLKDNKGETALSRGIRHEKVSLEDIRLFVQHGTFIRDCDYKQISENPSLKENVLKDVDVCTQSIVNKYHRHSLPALKGKFTGRLPSIDKFNLLPEHIQDVENFVKGDIQANTFCKVIQARPLVLRVMCVESLLGAGQSAMKRSAASDFDNGNSLFKTPRIN